jgi:hypothetical protein
MSTFEIRNLEIFWKFNEERSVIIYEDKSGLQKVDSVDTQFKPYQSAQFQGVVKSNFEGVHHVKSIYSGL